MNILQEELNKHESEYYEIFHRIWLDQAANKWMGVVRIRRKDTKEIVRGGFRVVDIEQCQIEKSILAKADSILKVDLLALGVPYEWSSPVRPILVNCLKFRAFVTKFREACDDAFSEKKPSSDFTMEYVQFWNSLIKKTISLSRSIESLTSQQRLDMLVSPDSVFDDLTDPWNLDDIDARIDVFKFFLNPSEAEFNAHKRQLNKLSLSTNS